MFVDAAPGAAPLLLAAAYEDDFEAQLALRMTTMAENLQRPGRFNLQAAREPLGRSFDPADTRHTVLLSVRVGPARPASGVGAVEWLKP